MPFSSSSDYSYTLLPVTCHRLQILKYLSVYLCSWYLKKKLRRAQKIHYSLKEKEERKSLSRMHYFNIRSFPTSWQGVGHLW